MKPVSYHARAVSASDADKVRQVVREYLADRDSPCPTCGYNLRGLKDENVCPECNAPVGQSLLGDRLEFANPRWLRRIGWGAFLAALTMITLPAGFEVCSAFGAIRR